MRNVLLAVALAVLVPWGVITLRVLGSFGAEGSAPAPDVALVGVDGRVTRLASLSGRVVLLDFWATWCAPCRASGPAIVDVAGRLDPAKAVVVGVSADRDEGRWLRFVATHPARRVEARDAGEAARRFGVTSWPTFVVVDQAGRVRWKQVGWTPFSYWVLRYRLARLLSGAG